MEKVLEIKEITKLYKNGRGIKNISFDIFKGDIFGFLGPNGAGKTTTMKVITGLCKADKGEVKLFGYDVFSQYEKAMQKVSCIIESVDLYEYMSAYENLRLAVRLYPSLKESRICEVLETVGLEKYKSEKVGSFSLGMKQRLGLASAILSDPELIILDEPTNGLDIEGMMDVRNIIKKLALEQKKTFLISSHLIHEMEITCNRIGIINQGILIETGFLKELLNNHYTLENYFISQVKKGRGV